jgi:hypothetical protein
MNKGKRWFVRAHRKDLDIEGRVTAPSPTEAFLRFVRRRRKVWPKGAYVCLQGFPGGRTYHAWPTWKAGGGTSLGELYVARIVPEGEHGA